jgi:antibiotic biosynthesis monooxygenase (ABM) superfamily enzyme
VPVITRLWRGWTSAEDADTYEELLRTKILPELRGIEGHRGATVLRRAAEAGVEFVVLNRFDSLDAVRAFAGSDYELAVISPEAEALLERGDERALHYETAIDAD